MTTASLISTDNRRRHDRRVAHWEIIVRMPNGKGFVSRTIDVSAGGTLIISPVKIPEGHVVTIHMKALIFGQNYNFRFTCECKFVTLAGSFYKCGMQLISPNARDTKLLNAYTSKQTSTQSLSSFYDRTDTSPLPSLNKVETIQQDILC